MTVQLPHDLYSPDQLSAVMIELHAYIGTLRDNAIRARIGKATEPPHASALLLGVLRNVNVKSAAEAEALLQELELIRYQAPVVHMTVGALPHRPAKRQITTWFREQIHPHTLLTFAVRTDIGGGLIMQAGSHVYDFSFRKRLLENKQRITEIFADVRQ